jgi:hypothetical protein
MARLGRAFVAGLWGAIGGPILWVILTRLYGEGSDAVLWGLLSAMILATAGYAATNFLLVSLSRRWSH